MGIDSAVDLSSSLFLILLALIFSISAYLIFFTFAGKSTRKKESELSVLKPYPILGHLPQFIINRHRVLDWLTDILEVSPSNTFVFHRPGNVNGVFTAHPDIVEHMLKSHFENYPKGEFFRSYFHDFLGRGIFNSDGELWRLQRKNASFEFNTRSFRSFIHRTVSGEISSHFLPLLHLASETGKQLDFQDALESFAFHSICKIAFGVDRACLDPSRSAGAAGLAHGFAEAFRDAAELSVGRFNYAVPGVWRVKKLLNIGSERRLRESIATVKEFAFQIIRSRRSNMHLSTVGGGDDLLSRFIAGEENNSDEFLRDIIISYLLAGRETTSSALTWFFWILSSRPDVERLILTEVTNVRASLATVPGTEFRLDELRKMQYLHAAVTEAMRLYPPVPLIVLNCSADEMLPDGTEIKEGWFISYNSYAMGRMKGIWGEDCRDFRPERWLDGATGEFRPESPFRFPAFNGGPRLCLGKEMAYIQMKMIVASVLEQFELEVLLDKDAVPAHQFSVTLRMRGGLPVGIRKRRSGG